MNIYEAYICIDETCLSTTSRINKEEFLEIYNVLNNIGECEGILDCKVVHPYNFKKDGYTVPFKIHIEPCRNHCEIATYESDVDEKLDIGGEIYLDPKVLKNYNTFLSIFAHELGHMVYYLKYGVVRDENTDEYMPYHKKKDETFADLIALICIGSVKAYQEGEKFSTLEQFHLIKNGMMEKGYIENVIIDGKGLFKNHVYDRYGRFKKLYELYPEKLASVGVAA